MPKRGEKNVFVSGIFTCPPLANALKTRSASASFGTESESEKPSKYHHLDFGAKRFAVKLDGLFAIPVEEEVGLNGSIVF